MKAQVMKRAWSIAKISVKRFGGKVKEYFAQALKMAWSEITGKEKAKEIRKQILVFWKEVADSIGTKGNCAYNAAQRRYEYLKNQKMDTISLLFNTVAIARWGVSEIVMNDIHVNKSTKQIIADGIAKLA